MDPRVVETELLDGGPMQPGVRIREVRQAGPKRLEQVVTVSEFDPPRRFGLRVEEGPFPLHAEMRFDPASEGSTVVRLRAHGRPRGPQLAAPVVTLLARRQMQSHQRRLRRALEG